jgi:DNA invertase Pin-like site-specific DNA recombinase
VRLSKAAGTENLSVAGMVADVERKAVELGATLIGPVRVDNGKSGAIRDRPEFVAWLDDVRECRASVMIPWHTDRLTREGVNAAALILDAQEGKDPTTGAVVRNPARLVDCAGLDSNDREGFRFRFVIGAEVARAERERIKARNVATRERLLTADRWPGGRVPLGFRPAPAPDGRGKVLELAPAEVEAMRDCLIGLQRGESLGSTVRAWNAGHGPRPRHADAWSVTTLRQALTSEAAQRRLWSPGEWRALEEELRVRAETGLNTGRTPAHLLSGLARCSGCGRDMHAGQRGGRHAAKSTIYRCNRRDGTCPTPGMSVSAPQLDAAVTAWFLDGWGGLPYAVERVLMVGADERALAATAEQEALAAFQADPSLQNADDYRLAKGRREALDNAAPEAERVLVPTGRTYAEEWARTVDVHARRAMLRDVLAYVLVAPGRAGVKVLAPGRYRIVTREELGDVDEDYNAE